MAYYRRLPSGKWQATVRRPDGRRVTKTDALKSILRTWANDEEARYASHWHRHCSPRWGTWPMEAITRMEAQAWVRDLRATPRAGTRPDDAGQTPLIGAETIGGAVNVMSMLYRAAIAERPRSC